MSNELSADLAPPERAQPSRSGPNTDKARQQRQRSEIRFPYEDLEAGLAIASVVHDRFGGSAEMEQAAGALGQSATSGSFQAKVGAARIFGLVTTAKGHIRMTTLGQQILVPELQRGAMVEAFLSVPLYASLYDAYKGSNLPGDAGLEARIRSLGAPDKQVRAARQVFLRSARQAGFFEVSEDRLVKPGVTTPPGQPQGGTNEEEGDDGTQGTAHTQATNVRSIKLRSGAPGGATVTLTLVGDLFAMTSADRDFVLRLVDEMAKHEDKRALTSGPPAEVASQSPRGDTNPVGSSDDVG